ncbi:MAG: HEPN family nuclease [Saprospiraceae bacterium]
MGNYKKIEHDFVERTLHLIVQYESILHQYEFKEQYNYTLLINCMLGVIVMPKERVFSHIPNHRMTKQLKMEMGLIDTTINPNITRLRDLIHGLRNSIAHFSIEIISETDDFLIDRIVFTKPAEFGGGEVANFSSSELLPFLRYYSTWLQSNLIKHS